LWQYKGAHLPALRSVQQSLTAQALAGTVGFAFLGFASFEGRGLSRSAILSNLL
jgi:hypothetical protein